MLNRLSFRKIILFLGDIILLYLSLIITLFLRFGQNFSLENFVKHVIPFSFLYLFWLFIFFVFDLYELDLLKIGVSFTIRILLAVSACFIVGIIFFYALPTIQPKTNLLILTIILAGGLLLWRRNFLKLFSSFFKNRLAVIGLTEETDELVFAFKNQPYLGYTLIEVIAEENLFNLPQTIKDSKLNTLVVGTKKLTSEKELRKTLYNCLKYRINIIDIAQAYEIIFQKIPIKNLDYLWFLENLQEGKKELFDKIKRIADIILASFFLLASLPFWLIITFLIKIDSRGPVFYKQKRVGKDKKVFWLLKFRSMQKEAEKDGPVWAEKKDPRVTRVGKILRKLHLDELPQMINIIKGDISLVGPRPERPIFVKRLEEQIPHYHLRHLIKPGFTGWAQIKFKYGRTVADSYDKFQYDLYYIKNRSLMLDLIILAKTSQLFFKRD